MYRSTNPSDKWGQITDVEVPHNCADEIINNYQGGTKNSKILMHQPHSSSSSSADDELNNPPLCRDPVLVHLMELRKYCSEIAKLLLKAKDLKKKAIDKGKQKNDLDHSIIVSAHSLEPAPVPSMYPACDVSRKQRHRFLLQGENLNKKKLQQEIQAFVEYVLLQSGYLEWEIGTVTYLADCTDEFLKRFMQVMTYHKKSYTSIEEDLLDHLESALQEIGFGGVGGIHNFYSQNIVKKCARLLEECNKMHQNYESIREELKMLK